MLKYTLLLLTVLVILSSCTQQNMPNDGVDPYITCATDTDCPSGVCNLIKADQGECAPTTCTPGDRTSTNHFFCNSSKEWQPSKQPGESCTEDYECFRQSCFMNPTCGLADIPAVSCKDDVCASEIQPNECEQRGMKKLLRKDQFNDQCFESLAQRILPTACAPCGNGICETELESKCNCPADCH